MSHRNEIIDGLWVGDRHACRDFQGRSMCVFEDFHPCDPAKCLHLRILNYNGEASRDRLTQAAKIIHNWMAGNRSPRPDQHVPVLVHCLAGVERSPLTVAWYLHLYKSMSLDEAYALIQSKRPEVLDRREWIEGPLFEGSVTA